MMILSVRQKSSLAPGQTNWPLRERESAVWKCYPGDFKSATTKVLHDRSSVPRSKQQGVQAQGGAALGEGSQEGGSIAAGQQSRIVVGDISLSTNTTLYTTPSHSVHQL